MSGGAGRSARVVAALLAGSVVPASADACCPAGPPESTVQIADQQVLIVWDEAAKVEHFVRRATFRTDEAGFGFLVPTPSKPELAEADGRVLDHLVVATWPKYPQLKGYRVLPIPLLAFPVLCLGLLGATGAAPVGAPHAVTVLESREVAGFDTVVLEASDPAALVTWLGEHGFAARPELVAWSAPYVAQGWKITAFRYAGDGPEVEHEADAPAVRMSFATDRPIFPYRVPTDQIREPGQGSTLDLLYVGPTMASGRLGTSGAWPAELRYAAPRPDLAEALDGVVPSHPETPWLHRFTDRMWPGGAEDLYFEPVRDPVPVVPDPVVIDRRIPIPVPPDVLLGVGILVYRRRRRRRG